MDDLIQLMTESLKEKIEKAKFKQVEKPRNSKGTKVAGRIISSAVKREVYLRDKKCVNCGTKHRLNFDHKDVGHGRPFYSDSRPLNLEDLEVHFRKLRPSNKNC